MFDRSRDVTHDQSRINAHDAIAGAQKRAIPTLIGADRASVIATVNFDDEPQRRRVQIRDEAAEERYLPPK
jgi:hypothetical protein